MDLSLIQDHPAALYGNHSHGSGVHLYVPRTKIDGMRDSTTSVEARIRVVERQLWLCHPELRVIS